MSDLLTFVEEIKMDTSLFFKIESLSNIEEFVILGKQYGYDFNIDDFEKESGGFGELDGNELTAVFGSDLTEVGSGPATCPCTWQD